MKKNYSFILLSIILTCWSLSILGETTNFQLPEIKKATRIVADNKQLYVVDGTSILIYSQKDFKLVKKFGQKGEGPGEFKDFIYYIDLQPDHMLIYSSGRLSWFTLQGNFIKQKKEPVMGANYKILGQNYVGMKLLREKEGIFFGICLFNRDLKIIKELHRYRHPFFRARNARINAVDVRISSYYIYNKKIFLDKADGSIWVFDRNGKQLHIIKNDLKPVRITPKYRDRWLDFWKTDLKAEYNAFKDRLRFPDYFPLIRDFIVTDEKIYLMTYTEQDNKNELRILDLEGRLQKRLWVPMTRVNPLLPHLLSLYTIRNDRLYILQDNPDTEIWEIRVVNLID